MLTYNHAPYIQKTLDGILRQQTDFGFEILIHDDASTDGTSEIIRGYQSRYPSIIKPIFQKINQWSQGINPSINFNYPRANAEYVAWCEGDDLWTDPLKLAVQIRGLQANPGCNLSFHQAMLVDCRLKFKDPVLIGNYSDDDRIVSFHETIYRPYGLIPTASCVVRLKIMQRLLYFMKPRSYIRGGDIFLQMFGAMEGGALYHAKPMSIYRYQTRHSLTRGWQDDAAKLANHQAAVIRAYIELNQETNGSMVRELKLLIFQRILWLFNRNPIPPSVIVEFNLNSLVKEFLKIKKTIQRKAEEMAASPRSHVIYGCGSGCALIMERIRPEKVLCIVDRDNKRIGTEVFGKPVISEQEIRNFRDCNLVISTLDPDRKVIRNLADRHDIPADHIQYFFDEPIDGVDIVALSGDARDAPIPTAGMQPPGWWLRPATKQTLLPFPS